MAQITYDDKVALYENTDIADINKVKASDMNEIKASVNNNDDMLNGKAVAGNMVVNSIRTKNMFDSSTLVQGDIVNGTPTLRMSSRQALWLEVGTYTFSTNMTSSYNYSLTTNAVGAPPLSSYPTYDINTSWQSSSTYTITLTSPGWFVLSLRRSDNGTFTSTDITNLKSFNYQLEKGSTATTYTPYQNLDGMNKEVIRTTATPNSSYISTVQINEVVKCGKVVSVDFRGLVSANIPNNTTIITLPYRFAAAGTAPAYLGGAYDYASTLWCSWSNSGNVFRAGTGFTSASGKYVHIHLVYITND